MATIQRITRKEKSENPPPLYDLTTLQRDANRLLGYSAQQMQYRPVLYNSMLLNGTLYPHLMELEQTAESRMQQTMEQLLKQDPAPDKAQNQLMWVQHMNSLKAQAEELVMTELIYS